jgi:hypothetical protein
MMKMKASSPRINEMNVVGVGFGIINYLLKSYALTRNITVSIPRMCGFCPMVTVSSQDF